MFLLVPVCALAVIGAAHTSVDALIGWCLLGAGAGVLVALGAPRLRRGRQIGTNGPDLAMGVAAGATFVTVCLVIVGLLSAFGGGFTTAALILLAVSGLWAGNHYRPRARELAAAVPNPHDLLAVVTLPASSTLVADMGTEELCVAWRHSYHQLVLAADEPARRQVVQRRQDFLDEIERRDGRGFRRWLDSGARAGGDPGPYLSTRSRPRRAGPS
jgi:hypothetical protein